MAVLCSQGESKQWSMAKGAEWISRRVCSLDPDMNQRLFNQ